MLAKVTGNASYAAEAQQPLAYTLTTIATYQASHGYREAVPTFMQISALRGGNSAVRKPRTHAPAGSRTDGSDSRTVRDQAFETHHTLHNMHRILEVSAALPPSSQLPVHVTSILIQCRRCTQQARG